jgi:hypothetical protein
MPMRTHHDVGAGPFGDAGELIDEGNLGRKHRVRGVLGEFGRTDVHHDQPVAVACEGLVVRAQQLGGAWIAGADDDAIRLREIVDRDTFLQ